MRILIALVVVALIGFFGSRMYQDKVAQEQVQQAAQQSAHQAERELRPSRRRRGTAKSGAGKAQQAASDLARQLASLEVGGIDVGAEIKNMVQQAMAALGSITDRASAEAALSSLDTLKDKGAGVAAQVEQLPAEAESSLPAWSALLMPPLKELAAKAGSIQGADAIKPSIDAMLTKLAAWANAQG